MVMCRPGPAASAFEPIATAQHDAKHPPQGGVRQWGVGVGASPQPADECRAFPPEDGGEVEGPFEAAERRAGDAARAPAVVSPSPWTVTAGRRPPQVSQSDTCKGVSYLGPRIRDIIWGARLSGVAPGGCLAMPVLGSGVPDNQRASGPDPV